VDVRVAAAEARSNRAGTECPILGVEPGLVTLALGVRSEGQQDLGERRWSRRRTTQDGVAAEQATKRRNPLSSSRSSSRNSS